MYDFHLIRFLSDPVRDETIPPKTVLCTIPNAFTSYEKHSWVLKTERSSNKKE
jgi:hypothetical protein